MAYPNNSLKTDAPVGSTTLAKDIDTVIKDGTINAFQERLAQNHVFSVSVTSGSENSVDFLDTGLHTHVTLARVWNSGDDTSPNEKLYYSGTTSDRTYAADPPYQYTDKTGTTKNGGVVFLKEVGYDTDDSGSDDLFIYELHFRNSAGTHQITYNDRLNVLVDDEYLEYNASDEITMIVPAFTDDDPITGDSGASGLFIPYCFTGSYSGSDTTDLEITICPTGYEIVKVDIYCISADAIGISILVNSGSFTVKDFNGDVKRATTAASDTIPEGNVATVKTDLRSIIVDDNVTYINDNGKTYFWIATCKKV